LPYGAGYSSYATASARNSAEKLDKLGPVELGQRRKRYISIFCRCMNRTPAPPGPKGEVIELSIHTVTSDVGIF